MNSIDIHANNRIGDSFDTNSPDIVLVPWDDHAY